MEKAKVKKALKTKLRLPHEKEGRHHYYYLEREGKMIAKISISHGRGEIPTRIVSRIAQELFVQPKVFREMVQCLIERDEFLKMSVEGWEKKYS